MGGIAMNEPLVFIILISTGGAYDRNRRAP